MRELIDPDRGMVLRSIAIEWRAIVPFAIVMAALVLLTCTVRL